MKTIREFYEKTANENPKKWFHWFIKPITGKKNDFTFLNFAYAEKPGDFHPLRTYVIPLSKVEKFMEYLRTGKNKPKEIDEFFIDGKLITDELVEELQEKYKKLGYL